MTQPTLKGDIPKLATVAFGKVLENPAYYLELAAQRPQLVKATAEERLVFMAYLLAETFVEITGRWIAQDSEAGDQV